MNRYNTEILGNGYSHSSLLPAVAVICIMFKAEP